MKEFVLIRSSRVSRILEQGSNMMKMVSVQPGMWGYERMEEASYHGTQIKWWKPGLENGMGWLNSEYILKEGLERLGDRLAWDMGNWSLIAKWATSLQGQRACPLTWFCPLYTSSHYPPSVTLASFAFPMPMLFLSPFCPRQSCVAPKFTRVSTQMSAPPEMQEMAFLTTHPK